MKKGAKVTVGVLSGVLLMGAVFGCLYSANSSVRGWVDNNINKITKDVPEEFKNVTVENVLELTTEQAKTQGIQKEKDADPYFNFKFDLKHLPTDFDGDDTLVTKVVTGDEDSVYFTLGDAKSYSAITHKAGDELTFAHTAFSKTNANSKYLIKTYWASYPDICINIELTFKSDYKVETPENSQEAGDQTSEANARLSMPSKLVLKATTLAENVEGDGTCELSAILLPEDATDKNIIWSVSNSKVTLSTTKNQSGDVITITAATPFEGAVQVIAKAEVNYNIYATCEVYYPSLA